MNREILFKAKRKDWKSLPKEKWWIEGAVLQSDDRAYIATSFVSGTEDEPLMVVAYEVIPDTICLYTGLTDKNDKKIWENDIVRYTFDYPSETATENGLKERISSVFWSEWRGSWSVYADERKGKGMNNDLFKYARNGNTVEVIGNIFDDKELLEVE